MRYFFIVILFSTLGLAKQVISQDTLIHSGATWRYIDQRTPPEYYWFAYDYEDANWAKGKTKFGYGEGDEVTLLDFGTDPNNKPITNYFRKSIYIENPNLYSVYLLRLMRDDGGIVYVNGREVWRSNMPEGLITDSTRAITTEANEEESIFYEYVLSPNYFIMGENLVSISVHQSRPFTSDCSFDFELVRHNDLFSVNHLLRNQEGSEQILNRSFSLLSIQLELETRNNEISNLKLQNSNLRNYGILLVITIFILLTVVFYFILRNVKISHKLGIELQGIKNQLEQKNKDIINYAVNMVQQKQFLKLIKEDLNTVCGKNKNSSDLDRIISKISYHDDHDDEWERLKVHFDTVHSGFFSRLKEKYPTLTQSEMQHCSYIKLQLPTKEIARMLNIDPKSVQASRYRIKKKMNLDLNTDLREVIESF